MKTIKSQLWQRIFFFNRPYKYVIIPFYYKHRPTKRSPKRDQVMESKHRHIFIGQYNRQTFIYSLAVKSTNYYKYEALT